MYFISFRLQAPWEEYEDLDRAVKAIGPWSNRMEPTWLVESRLGSVTIRDLLKPHVRPGDRVFVGQFSQNWAGSNMGEGFPDWLKRRHFANPIAPGS